MNSLKTTFFAGLAAMAATTASAAPATPVDAAAAATVEASASSAAQPSGEVPVSGSGCSRAVIQGINGNVQCSSDNPDAAYLDTFYDCTRALADTDRIYKYCMWPECPTGTEVGDKCSGSGMAGITCVAFGDGVNRCVPANELAVTGRLAYTAGGMTFSERVDPETYTYYGFCAQQSSGEFENSWQVQCG